MAHLNEIPTEKDLQNMKTMRLKSILAWYHIMLENIINNKYNEALEDSTMITYQIRHLIEEQNDAK